MFSANDFSYGDQNPRGETRPKFCFSGGDVMYRRFCPDIYEWNQRNFNHHGNKSIEIEDNYDVIE